MWEQTLGQMAGPGDGGDSFTRDEPGVHSSRVWSMEQAWVHWRRKRDLKRPEGRGATGLALSGGGLRATAFAMGVMQALGKGGLWRRVDFLSAVSGGGLAAMAHYQNTAEKGEDPENPGFFSKENEPGSIGPGLEPIIEKAAEFIPPLGGGLFLEAICPLLASAVQNAALWASLLWTLFRILDMRVSIGTLWEGLQWGSAGLLGIWFLGFLLEVLGWFPGRAARERRFVTTRRFFLMGALALGYLGLIPNAYVQIHFEKRWLMTIGIWGLMLLAAAMGGFWSQILRQKGDAQPLTAWKMMAMLLWLGWPLLLYAAYVRLIQLQVLGWVWGGAAAVMILTHPERSGFFRFFRRRIQHVFRSPRGGGDASALSLKDIHPRQGPYPIWNASVQEPGGQSWGPFMLSPSYIGSPRHGYLPTASWQRLSLLDAATLSACALDAQRGPGRIMDLMGLRGGLWLGAPQGQGQKLLGRMAWILGRFLFHGSRSLPVVHLSDGGFYDNTGLMELFRRRCSVIWAVDAGLERDTFCGSWAAAIFQAHLELGMCLDWEGEDSEGLRRARLKYSDGSTGYLVRMRPALAQGLSEPLQAYARTHPRFPRESTLDQSFSKVQFESYRELGLKAGEQLCQMENMRTAPSSGQTNREEEDGAG